MSRRGGIQPPSNEFLNVPYRGAVDWSQVFKDYINDNGRSFEERWHTLKEYNRILEARRAALGAAAEDNLDLFKKRVAVGNRKQDLLGNFLQNRRRQAKQLDSAGVVAIRDDNQVLYVTSPTGSVSFPKGHVDLVLDWGSETLEPAREEDGDEAALRELKEESGFVLQDEGGRELKGVAQANREIANRRPVFFMNGSTRAYRVQAIDYQNYPGSVRDKLVYLFVRSLPDVIPDPTLPPPGSEREVAHVNWKEQPFRGGIPYTRIDIPAFEEYQRKDPHAVILHPIFAPFAEPAGGAGAPAEPAAPAPARAVWRPRKDGWVNKRKTFSKDSSGRHGGGGTRRKRGLNNPRKS